MARLAEPAWYAASSLELFPLNEATTVIGLAAFLPILRFFLDVAIFSPVARRVVVPVPMRKQRVLPDKVGIRAQKLAESMWKLFCYSTFTALGAWATYNQAWLRDTKQLWSKWPDQIMTTPMRVLYSCELAYYLATILMLALWEVPRKDQHVMMAHHFATVVLIVFSYKYNYTRVGCVIMLLHDINDVLMETAKCLNYAEMDTAATTVFTAFVASWAILRITAFPYFIIGSTMFEVKDVLGYKPPHYALMNGLLVSLYAIHIYWFCLIIRIAWLTLTTGKGKDIREEEDD